MSSRNWNPHLLGAMLLLVGCASLPGFRINSEKQLIPGCANNATTAVRFFYNLGAKRTRDYFHGPLTFRSVSKEDSRFNTAPQVVDQGRTAYISENEMQNLIDGLVRSGLDWQRSQRVESLNWSASPLPDDDKMDVLAVCSKGTARAKLDPKKICETLKSLDSMLKTPRALWEFQLYRMGFGCKVASFDPEAYPDH